MAEQEIVKMIAEAFQRGRGEGFEEGKTEGFEKGYSEGYCEGYEDGFLRVMPEIEIESVFV